MPSHIMASLLNTKRRGRRHFLPREAAVRATDSSGKKKKKNESAEGSTCCPIILH